MPSRRSFITMSTAGLATTVGCSRLRAETVSVTRGYTFDRRGSLFPGQSDLSTDGFDSYLADSRDRIDSIAWRRFPQDSVEAYRSTTPPRSFLTVVCHPAPDGGHIGIEDYTLGGGELRVKYSTPRGGTRAKRVDRTFAYEVIKWSTSGRPPRTLAVEGVEETNP